MLTPEQHAILQALDAKQDKENVWMCRCPMHANGDQKRSLSITLGDDGWLHPKCFGHCNRDDVRQASGFKPAAWGPPREGKREKVVFKVVKTYPYRNSLGRLVYEVCRMEPKSFRRRRPFRGGWAWGTDGGKYKQVSDKKWIQGEGDIELPAVPLIPYRLPEVVKSSGLILIVEGEKDVDSLTELGLIATTWPGGTTDREIVQSAWCFRDRDVLIVPDNDGAGMKKALQLVGNLFGVASSIGLAKWPDDRGEKWDMTDEITLLAGNDGWPAKQAVKDRIKQELQDWLDQSQRYKRQQQ